MWEVEDLGSASRRHRAWVLRCVGGVVFLPWRVCKRGKRRRRGRTGAMLLDVGFMCAAGRTNMTVGSAKPFPRLGAVPK